MCILHYTFQAVQTVYENNPGLKPSMSVVASATSLQSCALNEIPAENAKPPTCINKRNSQGRVCRLGKANAWGSRAKNILKSKTEREASWIVSHFLLSLSLFLSPGSVMSPAISLLQEPPAVCKSKCAQASACCLQAAVQSVSFCSVCYELLASF